MRLGQRNAGDHLHLQIGAGKGERAISHLQQQVAQDRQRRTTTQRATDLLKRF